MDKKIRVNWYQRPAARMAMILCTVLLFLTIAIYYMGVAVRNPTVDTEDVKWEVLKSRPFAESVSLLTRVVPEEAIVIDAPTTGQVSAVRVSNGDRVKKGTALITLSNVEDEIRRMRDESSLQDQLAQSESSYIEVKKSVASKKKLLDDAEFELLKSERDLSDLTRLVQAKLMSEAAKSAAKDIVAYKKRQSQAAAADLELELETLENRSKRLDTSRKVLQRQLKILNRQAELSTIRAQESGNISGLSLKLGERVNQGDRIGVLATSPRKALSASVDEFYLKKIRINAKASFQTTDGQEYPMRVAQVNPIVEDGVFNITLEFTTGSPEGLIDGQSLTASVTTREQDSMLSLSHEVYEILKDRRELYILPETGKEAIKRRVRFGKIGQDFVELADGAAEGDAVIFMHPTDVTTKKFRLK